MIKTVTILGKNVGIT